MTRETVSMSIKKAARDYTCNKCHGDIPKGDMYVNVEVKKWNDVAHTPRPFASTRYPEHRTCPVTFKEAAVVYDAVLEVGDSAEMASKVRTVWLRMKETGR